MSNFCKPYHVNCCQMNYQTDEISTRSTRHPLWYNKNCFETVKKTNASTFLYTQLVTWDHLKHENSQSKNRQTFIRILKLKCVILLYKKNKKSQCSKLSVLGGGQPNFFFSCLIIYQGALYKLIMMIINMYTLYTKWLWVLFGWGLTALHCNIH